jgi:hypothetical protein
MLVYFMYLGYFTAIWPFGILYAFPVYFSCFGMMYVPIKIWQPLPDQLAVAILSSLALSLGT